ncbi:MAG: hypothetical protein Q4D81_07825, partial [Eubacteriales bacterium]|nr:hypothetical protein [Eubacteriales bacterium]
MDNRIELQKDDRLLFPGMECAIDYSIGRGSNVIAYVGRYRDHHNPSLFHRVLVRELFPYDPDGRISRCPDGSIRIDPEALPLYDLNRRTFQRGNEVHLRLLEENPSGIDLNINTFEYNNTLYSLVGYTGGRNLYEELGRTYWKDVKTSGTDRLLHIVRMMKGALGVLQTFHRSGFLHLDISPDNILLIGEGETERVTLIDYNSVHTLEEVRGKQPVYYSTKDGFTAPEVVMGRHRQIREWTDLYSMTAVLYLCLTGRKLSPVQMVGIEPISVEPAEVPLLKDCQETVLAVLRQILRRGLAVTPGRRYQNASQMLVDMTELEDRIEGRGITHWALWEAGRERIRRALKDNQALDYVMDDKKIYPLFARTEEGKQISVLQDSWFDIFGDTKKPILLLGGGGMGKTTALLRIGHTRNVRYTAASPAIYYISLYDYKEGDTSYICDRLLESLKFKPHTDSMESARQELMHLLDQPLRKHAIPSLPHSTDAIKDSDITQSCADISRENERPSVLLLLDGLNEASGDTASLLEEIHRLSDLAGVQIILTSRSDPKDPLFRRLTLCRIDQTEVRRILSEEGILPPENMEVMDLLSFPLLLSIYIRAVHDGGKQLRLESREQLLDDYFDSILEKEKRNLPDDTPVFMGILAAVRYLLPEIAAKTAEKRHALSEKELYSIVEKCYSELSKKAITSVYPDWIGHTPELRLGARTADEWYGKAVREILWKRLGLLVCDEKGHFRILHQMIEDYLTEKSRQFHEEFDREKRRQKNWRNAVIAAALISVLSGLVIYFFTTNRLLEQRQQDILRNESLALAYSSEAKLRDSDRNGAISDALSALPSEENKRPYVAEAEKALTDALYVYEDEKYHPSSMIRCENEIINCTVSDDGEYFIALDEFGQVCCYSTSSADMIWKKNVPLSEVTEDTDVDYVFNQTKGEYERETPEEPLPYLRILKKQNAVLYAGDYEEAILFYLNTGEELWRIPYDMAEINKFNPIKYMDVSEDESILVIAVLEQLTDEFSYKYEELYDDGFSYVEYLMNFDYNRILYFYDLETGNLLTKSEPVPVPSRYSCNYSGTGSFIKNGSAYVTV